MSQTRADAVYQRLREDILGGRLVPGQRLKFPELSDRYGTSVGATREALTRLVADGFVQTQAHQGFSVTSLSYEALTELTQARMEIESLVMRLSVLEGDMAWEAQLVAAHHVLEHTEDDWFSAHAAFHHALLAGCRNQRLHTIAKALRAEAELYVQWSVQFDPTRDVDGEHRALLDAAINRDAERAAELIREHIAHTSQLLIDGLHSG